MNAGQLCSTADTDISIRNTLIACSKSRTHTHAPARQSLSMPTAECQRAHPLRSLRRSRYTSTDTTQTTTQPATNACKPEGLPVPEILVSRYTGGSRWISAYPGPRVGVVQVLPSPQTRLDSLPTLVWGLQRSDSSVKVL